MNLWEFRYFAYKIRPIIVQIFFPRFALAPNYSVSVSSASSNTLLLINSGHTSSPTAPATINNHSVDTNAAKALTNIAVTGTAATLNDSMIPAARARYDSSSFLTNSTLKSVINRDATAPAMKLDTVTYAYMNTALP